MGDAGLAGWRASGRLSLEAIRDARAAGWSAAERTAVAGYVRRARETADHLFGDIRKLL